MQIRGDSGSKGSGHPLRNGGQPPSWDLSFLHPSLAPSHLGELFIVFLSFKLLRVLVTLEEGR